MKNLIIIALLTVSLALIGCGSKGGSAALGALGGAVISAGAYEIHMEKQLDRVEEDYENGKIDQREYEIRKDQIDRDSFFK